MLNSQSLIFDRSYSGGVDDSTGEVMPNALVIDAELRALIPPPSADELSQLEANLLAEGCRDALVTWNGTLIDGHNRYVICQQHGIQYRTVEHAFENRNDVKVWILQNQLGRRNLSEPTRVRLALQLKPALSEQAKERKKSGTKTDLRRKSDEGSEARTDDTLAKQAGVGKDKLRQAEYVFDHAPQWIAEDYEAENLTANRAYELTKTLETSAQPVREYAERLKIDDPHKITYLKELLNDAVERYGAANTSEGTFWEIYHSDYVQPGEDKEAVCFSTASLLTIKQALELKAKIHAQLAMDEAREQKRQRAQNLPAGVYNVVYADPPWQYGNTGVNGAAEAHYETMPTSDICTLLGNIQLQLDDNAVLFMWVTNAHVPDALEVLSAWGFTYKTNMVWVKTELDRPGSGWYVRGRHELLFIATRGSFTPLDNHIAPPIGSVFEAPLHKQHSRKPETPYSIIERLYPACRYVELFARRRRDGWDAFGNEVSDGAE